MEIKCNMLRFIACRDWCLNTSRDGTRSAGFAPMLSSAKKDWHPIPLEGGEKFVERCYDGVSNPKQKARACRHKLVE